MDLVGPLFCQICNVAIPHESARANHNQGKRHQLALHTNYMEKHNQIASVFTTGWPNAVDKEKIVNFMATFGDIQSHFLSQDKTFMIITYKSPDVAQDLIKRKKVKFCGRNISMSAKKRTEKPVQVPEPTPPKLFNRLLKVIFNQKSFGDEVIAVSEMVQPDMQVEVAKYMHLCKDLEHGLQMFFPHAKVHPFGSTITGLAFHDSDVDAFIHVPHPPQYKGGKPFSVQAVVRSRECLLRNSHFTNLVSIPRAKTPIVKCVHRPTGIKCDFNFKNMLGVCNSYFIQFVVRLEPKIKYCLLVLKFWGKVRELSQGNWCFTNYALTIMFIYYLQQEQYRFPSLRTLQSNPTVTNLQDGWNGGFDRMYPIDITEIRNASIYELLQGFFKFCLEYNYTQNVMCPYLGKDLLKSCFNNIADVPPEYEQYRKSYNDEHLKVNAPICLQDPFQHNRNLTGSLTNKFFEEYMDEIRRACEIFEKQEAHVLYNLFNEENEQVTRHTLRIKMPKQKDLQFLGIKVDGQQDQLHNLKLAWFDMLIMFVVVVLRDVFKFTLDIKKEDDSQSNPKKMKPTTDPVNTLYDTLHANGSCLFNLWDARNVIHNDINVSDKCNNSIQRQIEISEYIQNVLLQHVAPKEPIVNVSLTIEQYIIDTHVIITLETTDKKDDCANFYNSFALFFTKSFSSWLGLHIKEKNKAYLDTAKGGSDSGDTSTQEKIVLKEVSHDGAKKLSI